MGRLHRRHNANIRPIDEEALERAAQNIVRGGRRRRDVEPDVTTEEEEDEESAAEPVVDRVLVAQLPEAGGRWRQAHLNRDVIDQFFQAQPNTTQRVFLTAWEAGALAPQEVRPVIYSNTNKNMKIELGARRGVAYPTGTPPIAIFREVQVRTFRYMIVMPGEPGYQEMLGLTQTLPRLGRGLPRVPTDVNIVRAAWPACPLI